MVCSGRFRRRSDSCLVQRYQCRSCQRGFSQATFLPCYRQNKRHLNDKVRELLCSAVSLRRIALVLNLNRKTVERKLLYLGTQAEVRLEEINRSHPPAHVVEFDDLITIEHTKLKPLAVSVMVAYPERRILGVEVARIPASGLLAKLSRQKYGRRPNDSRKARHRLFTRLKPFIASEAEIKSDEWPAYEPDIHHHFPDCTHRQYRSQRATVAGQGELKQRGFDPLFRINHTLAMLRANVNRLLRHSWCTTKRPDRLRAHLLIYAVYHNEVLIQRRSQPAHR